MNPAPLKGEDGARVVLQGLPYAQVPQVALSLSSVAYQTLGALVTLARTSTRVEATDQELAALVTGRRYRVTRSRCSTATLQRALRALEEAGLIERRRRHGRRIILLLYTLAGRETKAGREAVGRRADLINALINCDDPGPTGQLHPLLKDDQCIDHPRSMHCSSVSSPPGSPLLSKKQEEQQQHGGASAPGVVAPPSHPADPGPDPEAAPVPTRSGFLRALAGDLAAALSCPAPAAETNRPTEPRQRTPVGRSGKGQSPTTPTSLPRRPPRER
jgi:hypothetical protein